MSKNSLPPLENSINSTTTHHIISIISESSFRYHRVHLHKEKMGKHTIQQTERWRWKPFTCPHDWKVQLLIYVRFQCIQSTQSTFVHARTLIYQRWSYKNLAGKESYSIRHTEKTTVQPHLPWYGSKSAQVSLHVRWSSLHEVQVGMAYTQWLPAKLLSTQDLACGFELLAFHSYAPYDSALQALKQPWAT